MNTQQFQNTIKNVQRTTGSFWLWLGLGILLFVATLAIQYVSRRAAIIPNTGASLFTAQSVPEAGAQGVADYIRAHSNPSAQAVPETGMQSVMDYIRLHSNDLSLREYTQEQAFREYWLGERYGVTPEKYTQEQALREYWLGERYGQTL